jgi:hypothetical protein
MRWLVAICLGTAGCYSPNVMVGATCDPATAVCPREQACVNTGDGYHCERSGGSGDHPDGAPSDGTPPIDTPALDPNLDEDGDGVNNGADNCPFVVNADQHNEDGDKFGDACDPCPILAAGIEADADGDGVGDNCDPHPNTPGDHIYLFETFKNGVQTGPGWDSYGTWTAAADSVSISVDSSAHANVSYTMPTTGTETITTAMTLTSIGTANNRGAGTIDEKGNAGSDGVACDLWANTSGTHELGLVHASTAAAGATDIMSTGFSWTLNTRYVIVETRQASNYTCSTGSSAANAMSTITNQMPQVGVWVSNASARFDYLFVVTSP